MYSHFRSNLTVLATGLVLAASTVSSSAQQAGLRADAPAPAVVAPAVLPEAPAPQIEVSSLVQPQSGQSASAPATQICTISGTATDVQNEIVPGATIMLEGALPDDRRQTVANDEGWFEFDGLKPGIAYHVTVKAKGFVNWESPAIVLSPGQYQIVPNIKLVIEGEQISVKVYASPVELQRSRSR